jgi:hypothetical protein
MTESRRPTHDRASTDWPSLPLAEWRDTLATLHMWTQIVGKIRLAQVPLINHWWNVTLHPTARGLSTGPMPYRSRTFQIDFDFLDHELRIETDDGGIRTVALEPRSVADFYDAVLRELRGLDIRVRLWPVPVEIANPIPFRKDGEHAAYDREYVERLWRILKRTARIMTEFRAPFLGKVSPVHFFWGSFDLAVTRFSGRPAPRHPGAPNVADSVTVEAYSHEVSSAGFWPGGGPGIEALFYAYAYPEPPGFKETAIRPAGASYSSEMGEFVLPYETLRGSPDPDAALLAFFETTYAAAADAARWDRAGLERPASTPARGRAAGAPGRGA